MMLALALLAAAPQNAAPLPVPPLAPPAARQVTADPAATAAAEKLIRLTDVEHTLDGMFVQLAPSFARSVIGVLATDPQSKPVIDTLVTRAPENRDRMIAILSQEFMKSIKRQYPALLKRMAAEYAASFTRGELESIAAFYSSGFGAKALKLMPQLQARMGAEGYALGKVAGAEAGQRAFERIRMEMLPENGSKNS